MKLMEERRMKMTSGCHIIRGSLSMGIRPFSGRLGAEEIRVGCAQMDPNFSHLYLS